MKRYPQWKEIYSIKESLISNWDFGFRHGCRSGRNKKWWQRAIKIATNLNNPHFTLREVLDVFLQFIFKL